MWGLKVLVYEALRYMHRQLKHVIGGLRSRERHNEELISERVYVCVCVCVCVCVYIYIYI